MFRARRLTLALVVALPLVSTALTTPVVWADVDPDVKKHYDLANQLYNEHRYADALVEYDAAYDLSHNFKILYNRGQCLVMLKREPDAIDSFERYLKDGGSALAADRRKQVEADIEGLKLRLGALVLEGVPEGAQVVLDGYPVATGPVRKAIPVGAGLHELSVRPIGATPYVTSVKVVAGSTTTQRVDLGPVVAAPTTASPVTTAALDAPPVLEPIPPRKDATLVAPRGVGGLVAPSLMFDLGAGLAFSGADQFAADRAAMPHASIGVSIRPASFWEFGISGAIASAGWNVTSELQSSQPNLGSRVTYGYNTLVVRARVHPIRGKGYDGWLGIDFGRYAESWSFDGPLAFKASAASALFGLGFGVDFALARTWAVGLSARYFGASVTRLDQNQCTGACSFPSDGKGPRGFAELGARVVWSIPIGGSPAAKPTSPSEVVTASTLDALF